MGECYIRRRGGGKGLPKFTYTGRYQLTDEGKGSWRLKLITSGVLTFAKLGSGEDGIDVFALGGGGAGASQGGAAAGGGGYYRAAAKRLETGTAYAVTVGAGGTGAGADGGDTAAFEITAAGGGAAEAGLTGYAVCQVVSPSGSGGNVYYYASLTASGTSIGSGVQTVYLYYPIATGQHSSGITLYKGVQGWYRCSISAAGEPVYDAGTPGLGAAMTRVFGDGEEVSGPGETENASRPGQGGGTGGIMGGDGLVAIRNTQPEPGTGLPEFTYTGNCSLIEDGGENWRIKFLSSGTLTFTKLGSGKGGVDLFLVGGGGGTYEKGTSGASGGAGGGYTLTEKALSLVKGMPYPVVVGAGGADGADGGDSSALWKTAGGGKGVNGSSNGGNGGSGGATYYNGSGGSDGGDGTGYTGGGQVRGKGQGTTTREFGEANGDLYAGGGACAIGSGTGGAGGGGGMLQNGTDNTGGGAGGSNENGHSGGSGIVIIRNHREAAV